MKIVAINGSHIGRAGNTNIMVTALLKGAQAMGAETNNIFLAEKDIKYCKACKMCWFKTLGKCVLKDDMSEILNSIEKADILILATPLYFDNISGMLKVFMDRLIVTASPYWEKDNDGECRHIRKSKAPKLIMMANCGYPERSHFQVISNWIKRVARNAATEVIGEIYASQGALLSTQVNELRPIISAYLQALERAGNEIVMNMTLSEETSKLLERNFIPNEIYTREAKSRCDCILGI